MNWLLPEYIADALPAEAERIERALKHPEHLVGSKEPVRDGHAATRFNGQGGHTVHSLI